MNGYVLVYVLTDEERSSYGRYDGRNRVITVLTLDDNHDKRTSDQTWRWFYSSASGLEDGIWEVFL